MECSWTRRLALVAGTAVLLACGGVSWPGSAGPANTDACRAYRDRYNALPCTRTDLPPSFCPEELDRAGCDATTYYTCLAEGVRCKGNLVDATGQLDCVAACP